MAEENSTKRRPEIRKDAVHNRWVIISPARSRRPSDFKSSKPTASTPDSLSNHTCAFCHGNEHLCAPEIFRVPPDSGDWKIRVIQNLYPALTRADEAVADGGGGGGGGSGDERIDGLGFHDVVIETPVHSVQLVDVDPVGIGNVLLAYKKRIDQLRSYDSIRYIQVFKNHGASAGASLSHSHSQMIALPIVPPAVSARVDSMRSYFELMGKCKLCEAQPVELLIDESAHFISLVPFAASYPFEVWIVPKSHSPHFHDLDNEKVVDLGGLLKLILSKIALQLNSPPFNFMIHTCPFQSSPSCEVYTHWFLQIIPQFSTVAGFEMGSGCYINPIFPEDAAKVLREVQLPS